ncbi:MAG: 2-amino-4-hydroxy-6-hydroxymethyldihydropteridine diphosphokinase [Siphonobacter sp.]
MNLFLLLGANLGDRQGTFQQARQAIIDHIGPIIQASSLWETAAWGLTDQPSFLNQVLLIHTALLPLEILQRTQAIEVTLGRVRKEKWGARLLDLDILYCGSEIYETSTLTIPHPYIAQRRFTLAPLAEIAPDFVHPVLKQTQLELLETCSDTSAVAIFNP